MTNACGCCCLCVRLPFYSSFLFLFLLFINQHAFSKLELAASFNYKLGWILLMCRVNDMDTSLLLQLSTLMKHEQIENQCTICTTTTKNNRIEYPFELSNAKAMCIAVCTL